VELLSNRSLPVSTIWPLGDPTFLLQAEDEDVDGVEQTLAYYVALQKAGVPTEMHLYAQGGHAFGLRKSTLPIAQWPRLVETWLRTIGMIAK
jgi:dipeptidyl aminopeptidase/acylaminoacyl peptidase